MDNLNKVTLKHIFQLWRNFTLSYLFLIVLILLCKYMPVYLSPIISLLSATILYTLIKSFNRSDYDSCQITLYSAFVSLLLYSIILIALNILYSLDIISIENEFLFINRPFKPILLYAPIALIVSTYIYKRKSNLSICINCKIDNGDSFEKGIIGRTQKYESYSQLKNNIYVYLTLTIVTWLYYQFTYVNININQRDSFVFVWFVLIVVIINIIYFSIRYYNLFLDLKESNQIIIDEDSELMHNTYTYLRYYVICGNNIYLTKNDSKKKIDTPFFIKLDASKISIEEATKIIKKSIGIDNGELRFYYGRISQKPLRNKMLRYFYFLKGNTEEYKIDKGGQWFNYDEFKSIYLNEPNKLNNILIADTTRLARIIIAEKTYDEKGNRKIKLNNYKPSFDLFDVYNSNINFQDNNWIRISLFNSDSKFYKLRKIFRTVFRSKKNRNTPPTSHES